VLLHGFLSSSRYWSKLRPLLLRDGYRIITIDLLGFGRAPKPQLADYSYEEHSKYIEAALRSLAIVQPFVIIGHSMGALLAARYSIRHPDTITAAILLHPPLYKDPQNARATLRKTGMLYRFLLDSPYRNLGWLLVKHGNLSPIGKHSHQAREQSLAAIIEAAEIFSDLEAMAVKTLVVVGKYDRKEYTDNLSELGVHNPRVTVSVEAVDHHSPRKHPTLVKDRIVWFIQKRVSALSNQALQK